MADEEEESTDEEEEGDTGGYHSSRRVDIFHHASQRGTDYGAYVKKPLSGRMGTILVVVIFIIGLRWSGKNGKIPRFWEALTTASPPIGSQGVQGPLKPPGLTPQNVGSGVMGAGQSAASTTMQGLVDLTHIGNPGIVPIG